VASNFSLEAIFSATDRISAPLAKIKSKLGDFGRAASGAVKSANRAVDKGLGAIGKFSNELGLAGVASIAGIAFQLKDVIERGAEFEAVLVKTGTAFEVPVKKGTKRFEQLVDAARKVGKTTEFSALQGAEGLNSLATAGYTIQQSIAALPKVLDFASAGQLELGAASDIASDTLGAFSLRSADAATNTRNMARVMDSMVRAAADSTTNVTQLSEGIRMGGAFAATSGQSIEEFVGMLGILANAGVKGSEAGTAIRNSFLHLTDVTKEAATTMQRLGIHIAKTKTGAIDMPATIGRFAKATEKLTKTQKAQAIASVFGAYTVGPFLNLMNAGEGAIRKFTANLEGAAGTAQTMAETMRDSTSAKIAKFFNIINDVKLGVFEAIAPTVLKIADNIGKWVTANQNLINTKAEEWATKLKDALPEIATQTERVVKALAGFVILAGIVKTISLLVTVIGWLSTAFAWAEFTALLLGTTIGAVIGPILLVAAAVAGLVALVWKFWPQISGFFTAVYHWAVKAIGDMWEWIKTAFASAKTFLVGVFEFIVGLLSLIFAPQIAVVKFFIGVLSSLFQTAVGWITAAWEPIKSWFAGLWGTLLTNVISFIDMLQKAWEPVATFFTDLWDGIVEKFWAVVDPILAGAKQIINLIRTVGRMTLGTADTEGGAATDTRATPAIVSPQARAASESADASANANVDGKITVSAEPGTKAKVKAKSKKVPLVVNPSGAF
jgi:TP901 family phage tail tape measure protein